MKILKSDDFYRLLWDKNSVDINFKNLVVNEFKKKFLAYMVRPEKNFHTRARQTLTRGAFLASDGNCLKWASRLHKKYHHFTPPRLSMNESSMLTELKNTGFTILDEQINQDDLTIIQDAFYDSYFNPINNKNSTIKLDKLNDYNSATYWITTNSARSLENLDPIKKLLSNKKILNIISHYLGSTPKYDYLNAWVSFPSKSQPCNNSAQLYHFDMDRVKWLKVFVYLNDVTQDNGPHSYISGSHNSIGKFAYKHGRYTDDEVLSHYGKNSEKLISGKAGTIIIEDTIGLHKGTAVNNGSRKILQLQFSINQFGFTPYV